MLLALVACGGGDGGAEPAPVLWPLPVGAEWTYRVAEIGATGVPLAERLVTVRVLREASIEGELWAVLSERPGLLPPLSIGESPEWIAANRPDGVWTGDAGDGAAFAPIRMLTFKYPAAVGESYGPNLSGGVSPVVRVAAVGVRRAVPAGTYDVHVYEQTFGGVTTRYEVAPGVGLVRASSARFATGATITVELVATHR
ncbi:MAG TPA: hypothetical protein VNA89_13520 [Gemmatimonadaceae bacterium]|nr:hypothetical protein [Gemmatimonadaceae bacterium]